jgi:hypothetical protein
MGIVNRQDLFTGFRAELHRLGSPFRGWRTDGGEFGDEGFEEVLGCGAGGGGRW